MKKGLLILFFCLLGNIGFTQTLPDKPKKSHVVDQVNLFANSDLQYFDSTFLLLQKSRKCGAYMITMDSLQGYTTIKEFAVALFDKWKLDKDSSLNYAIIYVKNIKGAMIQASPALLKITNKEFMNMILEKNMRPLFMQKKYVEAFKKGHTMMKRKIESN